MQPTAEEEDAETKWGKMAMKTMERMHPTEADLVVGALSYSKNGQYNPEEEILLARNGDGTATSAGAARIGPHLCDVECNASTIENVKEAVERRLTKKRLPFQGDKIPRVVAEIRGLVDNIRSRVFTRKAIQKWCMEKGFLPEKLASRKWNGERFAAAVEKLLAEVNQRWDLDISIKLEVMAVKDKPPRFLIADGDVGQVRALLSVACLEDILFHHYATQNIKHAARDEAVTKVLRSMQKVDKDTIFIEGDGSAWDSCCNTDVRNLVENPLIRHINSELQILCLFPSSWADKHLEIGEADELKPLHKPKGPNKKYEKYTRVCIPGIRRSGHRGTSSLNWLVNFVCWHCCAFKNGRDFWNATRRQAVTWGDRMVKVASGFEGDDSGLTVSAEIHHEFAEIEHKWNMLGFHMKLFMRGPQPYCSSQVAEFVGMKFLIDTTGPVIESLLPDPMRNVANASWTTAPECRDMTKSTEQRRASATQIGRSCLTARAHAFRNNAALRTYFSKLSLAHVKVSQERGFELRDKFEHEEAMKHGLETEDVGALLQAALDSEHVDQTDKLLEAMQLQATPAELATLSAWDPTDPLDTEDAVAHLPLAWKVALGA